MCTSASMTSKRALRSTPDFSLRRLPAQNPTTPNGCSKIHGSTLRFPVVVGGRDWTTWVFKPTRLMNCSNSKPKPAAQTWHRSMKGKPVAAMRKAKNTGSLIRKALRGNTSILWVTSRSFKPMQAQYRPMPAAHPIQAMHLRKLLHAAEQLPKPAAERHDRSCLQRSFCLHR